VPNQQSFQKKVFIIRVYMEGVYCGGNKRNTEKCHREGLSDPGGCKRGFEFARTKQKMMVRRKFGTRAVGGQSKSKGGSNNQETSNHK